jgi:RNA polymerase sigma-70 factor (ECF subfamily)
MDTVWAESEKIDEARVLNGMREGDERCFEKCVAQHGPRMLAVARRLLANDDDAQEAVQDAFLSAFRAIDGFDGRSQLGTWLYRIAVNAALAKLRARRDADQISINELLPRFKQDGHQLEPAVDWDDTAAGGLERSETRRTVREAIDKLPEIYRTVLLLRDIDGWGTEETARVLEVTAGVVKTRLHRARQALRTLLDSRFRGGGL